MKKHQSVPKLHPCNGDVLKLLQHVRREGGNLVTQRERFLTLCKIRWPRINFPNAKNNW